MQLNHTAKAKIIDPKLTHSLRAAQEGDVLDLTGDKAVYVVLNGDLEESRAALKAHGIAFEEKELNYLDEAFSTIYSPSKVEAGKLAKLVESSMVDVVEPQQRDIQLTR